MTVPATQVLSFATTIQRRMLGISEDKLTYSFVGRICRDKNVGELFEAFEDVKTFVELVAGRAKTVPMIETAPAMARLDSILDVDGVDELYIDLNDLHIGLDLTFMFEILSGGLLDYIAEKIHKKGIPFGFGGMTEIGEVTLPAERILAEHYRLGSSSAILSVLSETK